MSATLLRQMLEDASNFLKEEKYEQALDSARRVSQFDASNFKAFMCVGVASVQLKLYEDAEIAFRRAADLKPDLPPPWKNLVDVYDLVGDHIKKADALDKLIEVLQKSNKRKASQKWTVELAKTATILRAFTRAFDAWYSLVNETVEQEINEEIPRALEIWLSLVDLMQLPAFNMLETSFKPSMEILSKQFFQVARSYNEQEESETTRSRMEGAIAMFMRLHLDRIKQQTDANDKHVSIHTLDTITLDLLTWFPLTKLPIEYLLLRSEASDRPIDDARATQLSIQLSSIASKSPMYFIFQGIALVDQDPSKAREFLLEGLASCSASSFHESALSLRPYMALASLALLRHDVDECVQRLEQAKAIVREQNVRWGVQPHPSLFSDWIVWRMEGRAYELQFAEDRALVMYEQILKHPLAPIESIVEAAIATAELRIQQTQWTQAMEILVPLPSLTDPELHASVEVTRAWIQYHLDPSTLDHDIETFCHAVPILMNHSRSTKALYHKRWALLYWYKGGEYTQSKSYCLHQLLTAAKLDPVGADVFYWLGEWYCSIAKDTTRGEKCFVKALSLSKTCRMPHEQAGQSLSRLYEQLGQHEQQVALWKQLVLEAREHAPTWAALQLAQYQINHDDEAAISTLHVVLRNEPLNATHWVAMGHVYAHFNKKAAAQRSYQRAIDLGEQGWCVQCALARMESSMGRYDQALELLNESRNKSDGQDTNVVLQVVVEVLFQQAKAWNSEGLYGRASERIQQAAQTLQTLENSIPADVVRQRQLLKWKGDVHTYAYYLSPTCFNDWYEFLSQGRLAYGALVSILEDKEAVPVISQAHYDVALSCWYCAQATIDSEERNALIVQALNHLRQALSVDPTNVLAWNAMGVVHSHPIVKQFTWIRAIQIGNLDASWANLGLWYVDQYNLSTPVSIQHKVETLAQQALVQLQTVNPHHPAMWIGYGQLYLHQQQYTRAVDAFQCAFDLGTHVDALYGMVLSCLQAAKSEKEVPNITWPRLLFSIKKYQERVLDDADAWILQSVIQYQLGLIQGAIESSKKSLELMPSKGVERNCVMMETSTNASALWTELQGTQGMTTLMLVLQALEAFSRGDETSAIEHVQSSLAIAENDNMRRRIAQVGLALAARVKAHTSDLSVLADQCRSLLLQEWNEKKSKEAAHAIELYDRATHSFVSMMESNAFTSKCRFDFARVDGMSLKADNRTHNMTQHSDASVRDTKYSIAIISLLMPFNAVNNSRTIQASLGLVLLEPWNPYGYLLATNAMLQKMRLIGTKQDAIQERQALLTRSLRLLLTTQMMVNKSSPWQKWMDWTMASVSFEMGDADAVLKYAQQMTEVEANSSSMCLLWKARGLVLLNKVTSALETYYQVLRINRDNLDATLLVLCELASVLESTCRLDAALCVWKKIVTMTKTQEPECEENGKSNLSFVASLRMAILHGKKSNTKMAIKCSKVALATIDDKDMALQTTARFVESVLAKCT